MHPTRLHSAASSHETTYTSASDAHSDSTPLRSPGDSLQSPTQTLAPGSEAREAKRDQLRERWRVLTQQKLSKERKKELNSTAEEFRADTANSRAIVTVNLDHIRHNFKVAKELVNPPSAGEEATPVKCAVVLKANGYGVGASTIAAEIIEAGGRDFFVASVKEAQNLLRDLKEEGYSCEGKNINLYVLDGPTRGGEKALISNMEGVTIVPVLNSLEQLQTWSDFSSQHGGGKKMPAVLQFDTGMNRAGLSQEEFDILTKEPGEELDTAFQVLDKLGGAGLTEDEVQALKDPEKRKQLLANVDVKYVMSHLACASDRESEENRNQLERFDSIRAAFPNIPATLSASPGMYLGPEYRFGMVRLGSFTHGIEAPKDEKWDLKPAIKLETKIALLRRVPAGQGVGYGLRPNTKAEHDRIIATIPVGFADGIKREVDKGPVNFYINGKEAPVVSTSMDLTMLDVTGLEMQDRKIGARIEIVGDSGTLDTLAEKYGTVDACITTGLSPRVEQRLKLGTNSGGNSGEN